MLCERQLPEGHGLSSQFFVFAEENDLVLVAVVWVEDLVAGHFAVARLQVF